MQKLSKGHERHPAAVLCGKWYCCKCGLFNLNNEASRKDWAKNRCPGAEKEEAPEYTMVRK